MYVCWYEIIELPVNKRERGAVPTYQHLDDLIIITAIPQIL